MSKRWPWRPNALKRITIWVPRVGCRTGSNNALACYRQAVALKPDYAEALAALGHTLREQFRLAEAEQVFQRLLSVEPDSPSAQLGLGICYLLQEDYQRGWPAFEGRLRIAGARPLPDIPRWQGEDLTGRSLLVVAEAGFGDTLHFLRYAKLLKARGARVVFAVQPSLGRLLAAHPDIDELCLLDSGRELPRCDFCLSMLSLPGAFQTTAATIPREVPYLWADPALEEHWRRELAQIDAFKIGIVWQGSRVYVSNHWRSIPLAEFRATGCPERRAADQPAEGGWIGTSKGGRLSAARPFRPAG